MEQVTGDAQSRDAGGEPQVPTPRFKKGEGDI